MTERPMPSGDNDAPAVAGWRKWALTVVGTSLGLGYSPVASGTVGTLPALALFWVFWRFFPVSMMTWLLAASLAVVCVACVVLGNWAEGYWKKKDPGTFVLDEVAGYLLTVLLFHGSKFWPTLLWTFLATRVLDIVKVPPARRLEHLRGGWGILLDDLVSSLYAAALLHVLARCGLLPFMA